MTLDTHSQYNIYFSWIFYFFYLFCENEELIFKICAEMWFLTKKKNYIYIYIYIYIHHRLLKYKSIIHSNMFSSVHPLLSFHIKIHQYISLEFIWMVFAC